MVYTSDTRDFLSLNHKELRFLTSKLCLKYNIIGDLDDILQDLYLRFISRDIIKEKFNPDYTGEGQITKQIQTYMYTVIRYAVINHLRNQENQIESARYPIFPMDQNHPAEEYEIALFCNKLAVEYESRHNSNSISDQFEAQFDDFEDFLQASTKYNKVWKLTKSKGAKDPTRKIKDISLSAIFFWLRNGYNRSQIAEIYGVTPTLIGLLMPKLRDAVKEFFFPVD